MCPTLSLKRLMLTRTPLTLAQFIKCFKIEQCNDLSLTCKYHLRAKWLFISEINDIP